MLVGMHRLVYRVLYIIGYYDSYTENSPSNGHGTITNNTLVQEILTARILDDRYYDGKKLRRFFPQKIGTIFPENLHYCSLKTVLIFLFYQSCNSI